MATSTTEIFSTPVGAISGSTPYGYYDSDTAFQTDGPKFCNSSARKLGYPVIDVELPTGSMFAVFEDAVTEFSYIINQNNAANNFLDLKGKPTTTDATGKEISANYLRTMISISDQYGVEAGAGGSVTWHTGSIYTTASVQDYDLKALYEDAVLGGADIEIKKVYHNRTPASLRYFDPAVGVRELSDTFPMNTHSGYSYLMFPIYDDLLKMQAIEFNDTVRRSWYSFRLINNVLRLFPAPDAAVEIHFEYVLKTDMDAVGGVQTGSNVVSDISNVPYANLTYTNINSVGKKWIGNYGFALVEEMLGRVRSKYQSIPSANGDIALDGPELVSSGEEAQDKLKEQLKEVMERMQPSAQLIEKNEQSEAINDELNRIPMPIYIK